MPAVLICLLANGVPTPYGSIGIPTVSVADLVGLDSLHLATVQLVQLAPFFVVMPLFIVLVAGRVADDQGNAASVGERLHGVAGVALLSGVSFVGAALVVAMFVGPELAVVVGSIVSLALTAALAMRAEKSGRLDARFHMNIEAGEKLTVKSALSAWSCFILIFVLLLGTSNLVPAVHAALAPFASHVQVYCGENPGTLTFSWINTPGVWIFLAAFAGGAIQGASPRMMGEVLAATVKQMMPTVITMLSVLGCAKVMGYAGMISSISAFCIAVAGGLYPILAPWIGAVGAFVTGSGTSSGMLFGPIQSQAATALGVSDYWMVALTPWASPPVR